MVTHNFSQKLFPWQLESCEMSTVSALASIPSVAEIGLKLTKIQSEVALFSNIFSKNVILPHGTCAIINNLKISSTHNCNYDLKGQ